MVARHVTGNCSQMIPNAHQKTGKANKIELNCKAVTKDQIQKINLALTTSSSRTKCSAFNVVFSMHEHMFVVLLSSHKFLVTNNTSVFIVSSMYC